MCGEYGQTWSRYDAEVGSPPHVWRIRKGPKDIEGLFRITSTCVENTMLMALLNGKHQDHLHMCGEYLISKLYISITQGSPPHVWRIHQHQTQHSYTTVDHLHMCGEYITGLNNQLNDLGSPPHVWRIHCPRAVFTIFGGITSTCVENTVLLKSPPCKRQDHLHIRGEY